MSRYKEHSKRNEQQNQYEILKFCRDLDFMLKLHKNIKVLEIGYSSGRFTSFCKEIEVKKYIGIEIDDSFGEEFLLKFPGYSFYKDDACHFLENTEEKFDVIFMAHVFEHLPEDETLKVIKLIYNHLNVDGYYINYMPNAACLKGCTYMYHDITHKRIYDSDSFEQISYISNIHWNEIIHKNTIPAVSPFLVFMFKIINPIFVLFSKIYYFGMGYLFPHIYSSEILSILRK